jgi:cytochrome c nitrite reductase small subunit
MVSPPAESVGKRRSPASEKSYFTTRNSLLRRIYQRGSWLQQANARAGGHHDMMMNRISTSVLVPALAASLLVGSAAGIGAYTFIYAQGGSYLSNNPEACGNCHIMQDHLSAWNRGSHSAVATCNDCHAPHGNVVAKFANKATNGFRHSLGFTTGNFPDPLRITDGNTRVTEAACRHCHEKVTVVIEPDAHAGGGEEGGMSCISCHARVGHWVR